jgi:CTP synthase (UTP-ammonia lyase)
MVHMEQVCVGIVGDFCSDNPTHVATIHALGHAADQLDMRVVAEWLSTDDPSLLSRVRDYDALWISPGSPYKNMEPAVETIRFARENDRPVIGTCGGFQHMVIEFARNVLGHKEAHHAEYEPNASSLFITQLACSLVGKKLPVKLDSGSRAFEFYGRQAEVVEDYYCNFGLNPEHEVALETGGLRISGRDEIGEARVIEIPENRFFIGTLFVPQAQSMTSSPHPLILSFVEQAALLPSH